MPMSRQQRYIHRELLRNNVIPFDQWKSERKDLSYFHKNIIDYDYSVRTHIFMSSGRYRSNFPIKVKHRGWPIHNPMTPQAWTAMELLIGLKHFNFDHNYNSEEIYKGCYFISTCILQSEVEMLWDELLSTIYICTEDKADIWVVLFHSIITGIQNGYPECDITEPSNDYVKEYMKIFLDRNKKIELIREYYHNRKDAFDRFICWLYRNGPTPLILRRFFSLERTFWEHRYSSPLVQSLPSQQHITYPYHPQSPLEQISPSGSTSSPSSPSEECL